jgi:hypothetical protein
MKKILGFLLLSFIVFSGCKKDNTSPESYTPTCTGAEKSYKNDVAPVIASACSGCHQNYNTYSQVSASRSSIRSVIVNGSMPRGGSLSTAQKDAIVCWIDNGAVNN